MTVSVKTREDLECTGERDCPCCQTRTPKRVRRHEHRASRHDARGELRRYVGRIS